MRSSPLFLPPEEAAEVLEAIRNNEVDALVVATPEGDRIFTLDSAERPYRTLVEQMPEGAVTLSRDGLVLYCNQRFAELVGQRYGKVVAAPFLAFVPPDDRPGLARLLSQPPGAFRLETSVASAQGPVPVLLTGAPLPNEGPAALALVVTDLTEQKRSEEMVASERLARSILDNAVEAVVVCDPETRIIRASLSAQDICGVAVVGTRFGQAFPLQVPRPGEPECVDGAPPEVAPEVARALDAALRGQTAGGVQAVLCGGGRSRRHLMLSAGPLRNERQKIVGCVVTLADVTAYKQAEEVLRLSRADIEVLNERLRRAMGETHHRVKNNLQVIAALVDMQLMSGADAVPMGELRRIGQHVRALAAVHELLTYEALGPGDVENVSALRALTRLEPLLSSVANGRLLRFQVADMQMPVRQATALAVLVNELVSNAVKHGEGEVELSLTRVGERAWLEVADHGPGFAADFDASEAASTGLELVQSLSRWDLGGDVVFGNRPGGGGRVVVSFPVVAGQPGPC